MRAAGGGGGGGLGARFAKTKPGGRVAGRSLKLEVMLLCAKGVAWAGEGEGRSFCFERASEDHQTR